MMLKLIWSPKTFPLQNLMDWTSGPDYDGLLDIGIIL